MADQIGAVAGLFLLMSILLGIIALVLQEYDRDRIAGIIMKCAVTCVTIALIILFGAAFLSLLFSIIRG